MMLAGLDGAWSLGLQLATPIAVGIVGALIKRALGDMDRRMAEQKNTQEKFDQRLAALEADAVTKEEFLRDVGQNRITMNQILKDINELNGRHDEGVQIAAAIAAALNKQNPK